MNDEQQEKKVEKKYLETRVKLLDLLLYCCLFILNAISLSLAVVFKETIIILLSFIAVIIINYYFGRLMGAKEVFEIKEK